LLAQVATSVIGIEIAEDAVTHASSSYERPNLKFLQGDAREMPIPDGSADIVVSFETIEHISGADRFLAEVRRVLRTDGLLIVSTPDRDNYSPAETAANPFHVLEYTREEFLLLLSQHFAHVTCLQQRPMIGSAMLPAPNSASGSPPLTFERRGDDHFEGSVGLARPHYIVAFASNHTIASPPASVYIESSRVGLLSPLPASAEPDGPLGALHKELEVARAECAALKQELEVARAECAALKQELEVARAECAALKQELEAARAECLALKRASECAEQAGVLMRDQLVELRVQLAQCQNETASLNQVREAQLAQCQNETADLNRRLTQCQNETASLNQVRERLAQCRNDTADLNKVIADFQASTSWRLTAPLRAVVATFGLSRKRLKGK
jgi:SAM-dependent methyltransferase